METENNQRRKFLKSCGILGIGMFSGSLLLNSCSKQVLSPFRTGYSINLKKCTGCGDCVPSCYYKAIVLPEKTKYYIDKDLCTECGQCVPKCTQSAISVSQANYVFDEAKCVGCGKCIDVCKNEGNCITYEKADYTIRNKCKPNRCHHQCQSACQFGAITIGDRSNIDPKKCTKCGKCVAACPYGAVNPAKVTKNESLCTHCGLCLKECTEFKAISKSYSGTHAEPLIDPAKCTACGDCKTFCTKENAIKYNSAYAIIDRKLCTDCGKCEPTCKYKAIELIEQ